MPLFTSGGLGLGLVGSGLGLVILVLVLITSLIPEPVKQDKCENFASDCQELIYLGDCRRELGLLSPWRCAR